MRDTLIGNGSLNLIGSRGDLVFLERKGTPIRVDMQPRWSPDGPPFAESWEMSLRHANREAPQKQDTAPDLSTALRKGLQWLTEAAGPVQVEIPEEVSAK